MNANEVSLDVDGRPRSLQPAAAAAAARCGRAAHLLPAPP